MLVRTTELAMRALLLMALEGDGTPVTPRQLAERLDCSATYLGKTLGLLVKSGVLEALRGAHGGVVLRKPTEEITILEIVEACQGVLVADFCLGTAPTEAQCAYHLAMRDVYEKTRGALESWTLADLVARPVRCRSVRGGIACKMRFRGSARYAGWAGAPADGRFPPGCTGELAQDPGDPD